MRFRTSAARDIVLSPWRRRSWHPPVLSWKQAAFTAECGEGHLRLCFGSQPYERIEAAMDRLAGFFGGIAT